MRLSSDNNILAFFELLRAGLWEKEARLSQYSEIDYAAIMRMAEEQSVVGLITAGMEHVVDVKVPQVELLQFIGSTIQIEQQNKAMNEFVAKLIEMLRENDIYTLLVKGQGIAQCYERPLWRSSGDVDLYLSENNYHAAKRILEPMASQIEEENESRLHLAMTIDGWVVELHGTLHSDISSRLNSVLDEIHCNIFNGGAIRSWDNGGVTVFLPSADNDVVIVFAHILQHFFVEGIGLRQICDWCRLLWTYRETIDKKMLEYHIAKMGLMSEWKAFGSMAVDWLGGYKEAIPLYCEKQCWKNKGSRIMELILDTGNFGQRRDLGYKTRYLTPISYIISFKRHTSDLFKKLFIFPSDAIVSWRKTMWNALGF